MGGKTKHVLLTPVFQLFGTEGSLVYVSSGLLGFLEERHPVSQRIGEVRYSSGNKFKVGLLTLNKNERKNLGFFRMKSMTFFSKTKLILFSQVDYLTKFTVIERFPCGSSGKEPSCQGRRHKRHRFNPWVRKIPWGMA